MLHHRFFTAALAAALLSSVNAAETPERVVVTGVRAEQAAEASLASVSVIDREQIEISQAPDLLELLRTEAGVDLTRGGGPGLQTSVFLRGANSNHVLVLIDGVRVAASGTGAFAWELIDLNLVERIEIVRGPRAARWGSDAIGGVIQIFTRRAEGFEARAGYGRYRDRSFSAAAGTGQAGISAAVRRVGGFSAQNERGFAFDPDNDGFALLSLAGGGSHALGGGVLSWQGRLADGEVEFDQGESEVRNYAAGLDYRFGEAAGWQYQLGLAAYRDRLETEAPFGSSEAITRRSQLSAQAGRQLGALGRLLLGADAWRESGVDRGQWSETRDNLGAWVGLDGRRERLDYETALRVDRDENYGSAVTGNLALGWRLTEAWQLTGGVGRGFRSPSFSQLYSPGFFGSFAGNPELDPETSWSSELGLRWQPAAGHRLSLAVYQTRIDDLIDFAGADFQAINIRKARIEGAELAHDYGGRQWRARSSLSWQSTEDRDTGLELLRRPSRKAGFSVDRMLGDRGWLGTELVYVGDRVDVGREVLPAYTLINLRAGYPLTDTLRLEGRVENLTDRDYEPLVGFNSHRRSLFVALHWQR